MTITTLDWIVIIGYFTAMLLLGFYFSTKNKNTEDYMLGGRNMSSWKVGLSLFATMFSAVSYLSMPGEMIKYGPMIWSSLFALPFIYLVVAYYFIPYIMRIKITSAYELLETKLDIRNRIVAASYFLIMRIVWMAVIIFMVSEKVIVPIMGWPEEKSLLVSIIIGVVTVIYTSFGGFKSVVLSDVVQTAILFFGSIIAIIIIVNKLEGVSNIVPTEWPEQWAEWKFFDPHARLSFLTVVLTTFGWYVCTAGSDQMAIQRYLATANVKTARRMYLNSIVSNALVTILLAVLGFALFAYFKLNPDLLTNGKTVLDDTDALFPTFIVIGLPAGFSGLVLAGLLAASMSSLSSGINSSAMSIINDFILRFRKKAITEKDQMKMAKYISLGIGLVIVLLSLVVGNIQGNLLEITYKTINLLVAPLFVPFFMAMFVKRAKPTATFIGTLSSGVAAVLISFSKEFFGESISFLWIIPGSFIVGVVISFVLSYKKE
ncbi:sodium:solute symporter family transporter [Arenibacter algicola]|uniref:Sodium/pantothenate symporter n=1 Tax=Arenibacter algicola TaxID=616991 RepID=A0A221UTB1_9FLAO|nr:sodium/solute symporter [Arenibacter algicola]ASO04629.1 sodium/pantothenate symporter [Arenibacter algicola]